MNAFRWKFTCPECGKAWLVNHQPDPFIFCFECCTPLYHGCAGARKLTLNEEFTFWFLYGDDLMPREEQPIDSPIIAVSAFKAWLHAMDQFEHADDLDAWEQSPPELQGGWLRTCYEMMSWMEQQQGTQWTEVASRAYNTFQDEMGIDPKTDFEDTPEQHRLAWQAYCRHIVNLMGLEQGDNEDLSAHESEWNTWVHNKLAEKVN